MEIANLLASYLSQEWSIEVPADPSVEEMTQRLSEHVHHLINHDFDRLVTLLYRIDVNESKLKYLLKENPGEDAGKIIAGLIIERQLQKIQTRKNYKSGNAECDEEKW